MIKKKKNRSKVPKIIVLFTKLLFKISQRLTLLFIKRLFSTPIKYKMPKREFTMDKNSIQTNVFIPEIKKEIVVYKYGKSDKKVLLIHGWSGRGTQLATIAEALLKKGYSTISFDAPAHGKAKGKTSLMSEFIAATLHLEQLYGSFDFVIGHSLGGMTTLNSLKKGLLVKKAVIIGSGDSVIDILKGFVAQLQLPVFMAHKMRESYEKELQEPMENYAGYIVAPAITIPVFAIHDKDDDDVPYTTSVNIVNHLKNGKLLLTEGLGHRKILGDATVVQEIMSFLEK